MSLHCEIYFKPTEQNSIEFHYEVCSFINEKIEEYVSAKASKEIFYVIEMNLGEPNFYQDRLEFSFPEHCLVAAETSVYWYKLIICKYFKQIQEIAKNFGFEIIQTNTSIEKIIMEQPAIAMIFEYKEELFYFSKNAEELISCHVENWERFTAEERKEILRIFEKGVCTDDLTIKLSQ